tara:strand:- start:857 stop:1387 length:531 start_codon:yes stop_codon:yes gene_type:complete
MLNEKDFAKIRSVLDERENHREKMILLSRAVIKESKLIIYALQRGDEVSIEKISEMVKEIDTESLGLARVAVQEYVEAVCFYHFVKDGKLISADELGVDVEHYLLGVCDLTGELVRKAVKDAIEKKYDDVTKATKFVEEIYGEFLKFNLRNGELRKKSDAIKWNLQKLEQLSLDIA